jgi:8-oxo-dGTP pyrophosphatase MutT (NUDIX family)
MEENTVFNGKIGEVIHTTQPDGRIFERYRRPPGVRLVIVTEDQKIIMTREHRQEAGGVDLRLPGGKVRDTLGEYHELLGSGQDLLEAAKEAGVKEAAEEVGLNVKNLQFLARANAGATVEYDLYYFMTTDYQASPNGQELELGEDIEVVELSLEQITEAISNGQMQEWRSVGILLGLVLPKLKAGKAL